MKYKKGETILGKEILAVRINKKQYRHKSTGLIYRTINKKVCECRCGVCGHIHDQTIDALGKNLRTVRERGLDPKTHMSRCVKCKNYPETRKSRRIEVIAREYEEIVDVIPSMPCGEIASRPYVWGMR